MKDFLQHPIKFFTVGKKFLSSHHAYIFYSSLLLIPVIFFLLTHIASLLMQNLIITPDPFPVMKTTAYPLFERVFAPVISAQAAYILEADSRVVLFEKNETVRFSPASTTKMMTALVALDYFNMNDTLTIMRSNVEPVVVGFPLGAKVKFEDMLYAMLVPSGNDAALAIADNYPGGESAFVDAMNKKAKLLHLDNTHFGDPVGLIDDEDYSTVRDMALLALYTKQHPILSDIVATKEKIIYDQAGSKYDLKNTNQLLGLYGVDGVKTGYTGEAGEVLVTSTHIQGHTFILVVMKSDNRFADTEKLLQLLQDNITFVPIRP